MSRGQPGGVLRRIRAGAYDIGGDLGLHRLLDDRFELVDAVDARNVSSPERWHRWRISAHRRR